ncbi:hypothetical protein [Ochrobactrum sp. A-1]|uniref:hypothetical protein n=1 Tax=Ochrobactrum sp. A-1 TaxID=2920940 RepID=UPI001F0B307D|nr:hypothetical protein [Ochrobactrum sp. A-1]
MEKSAHPAHIAARLNNLEQKFDEVQSADFLEALNFLYNRALLGSEKNSGSGLSDKFWKNPSLFDDFSLSMAVFGLGLENFQIYEAQKTLNFYNRVFGSAVNFENAGSVLPLSHALFLNVGKSFTYEWNDKSLTETIFGSDVNISYLHETGSLFDKLIGNGSEYLRNEVSLFDFVFGEGAEYLNGEASFFYKVFGTRFTIDEKMDEISGDDNPQSFLDAVRQFRRDFDYFEMLFEIYKENVEQRLVSLSQRVSNLESKI